VDVAETLEVTAVVEMVVVTATAETAVQAVTVAVTAGKPLFLQNAPFGGFYSIFPI